MKTLVNAQGCNTVPGEVGLFVEGSLVVNGINIVQALGHATNALKAVGNNQNDEVRTALRMLEEIENKLKSYSSVEKETRKAILDSQTTIDSLKKELKSSQEENKKLNEKLNERLKVLETELKKLSKTSKKDSDSTEPT